MKSISGSITAGGTAQFVSVPKARTYLLIQNKAASTESFWVSFGGPAATTDSPSIEVTPGSTLTFEDKYVPTDNISVIAISTGTKYTIWEEA